MAVELCRELEEVVSSCVLDANASHVVQKCIEFLPSDQIAFLLEPLCDNVRICLWNIVRVGLGLSD